MSRDFPLITSSLCSRWLTQSHAGACACLDETRVAILYPLSLPVGFVTLSLSHASRRDPLIKPTRGRASLIKRRDWVPSSSAQRMQQRLLEEKTAYLD